MVADLQWLADWTERLQGVRILGDESWSAQDAELQIWCDASNFGPGFISAKPNIGYFFQREDDRSEAQSHPFFFEELCLVSASAFLWAAQLRLAIHSDSAKYSRRV